MIKMAKMGLLTGKRFAIILGVILAFVLSALQGCFLFEDGPGNGGPSSRGFFRITFPTLGSSLNLDSTYQVLWTPSTGVEGGTVRISLYQGDALRLQVAAAASNSGSYSWNLATLRALSGYRVGSGNNFTLRITSGTDTSKWDHSAPFALYSRYTGSVAVTSPEPGAIARVDSSLGIRWVSTGEPGPSVGIQLYKDTALVSTILSATANSGYYLWTRVATTMGSGEDYRIRVFSLGDPSIQGMSQPFRIATTFDGTLALTAPEAGDTLTAGTATNIAWTAAGNAGTTASLTLWSDSTLVRSISTVNLSSESMAWTVTAGLPSGNRYRIRMVSTSDAGIAAWTGFFTIRGADPDDYEKDDSLSLAKAIPVDGQVQQRSITLQDIDWIRFQAVKGKRYLAAFRVAPGGSTGVTAYAADSSGNTVVSSQSGSNFNILVNPAYSGRHHLRVSPYTGYGPYSVSVTEFDSTESSAKVVFSAPDSAATWAAGSAYSIKWTPDSLFYGSYVNLSLYLESELVQSIGSTVTNSGTYSWSLPVSLITSSKYRIRIAAYNNTQVYAYSPYFSISGQTADPFEPDNTRLTAKALPADGTVQARSLTTSDQDWMRIDAKASKRYLATFTSTAVSMYTTVQDSAGRNVGSSQSGGQITVVVSPTYDGPYYIQAQPSSGTGAYSVSLVQYDAVLGGFPARFISPDSTTTWASGSSYTVTWTPDTTVFGRFVSLALYRDTAFIQTFTSSVSNAGTSAVTVPSNLASGGNYRVRLISTANAFVYGSSPAFSISGQAPDVLEPNDSAGGAKAVVPNQGRQSLSLSYRDKDWFKFTAKAQMLYVFQAVSATALPTTMRLYSGLGTTLINTNNKTGSDSVNSLAWVSPSDGVHSLLVEPYNSSSSYSGPYALEIKEVDPATYKFSVTSPVKDTTLKAAQTVTIQWSDPAGVKGRVDIFLYNEAGVVQTISANALNTGTYSWAVPAGLPSLTSYYVRVISLLNNAISGSSGTFAITP